MSHPVMRVLVLSAAVWGMQGCTSLGQVSPWEKGHLAKPEMGFDADRLDAGFVEHIYSSKEAAAGGFGVGGGGCGCN